MTEALDMSLPIYGDELMDATLIAAVEATADLAPDRRNLIAGMLRKDINAPVSLIELAQILETLNEPEFLEPGPRRCGLPECNCDSRVIRS